MGIATGQSNSGSWNQWRVDMQLNVKVACILIIYICTTIYIKQL